MPVAKWELETCLENVLAVSMVMQLILSIALLICSAVLFYVARKLKKSR